MQTYTCSYVTLTRCVRQTSRSGVYKLRNTTVSVLACIAQRRGALVSPDLLARLGSSIASTKALVHAPVPQLFIARYEARAAIERWCAFKA